MRLARRNTLFCVRECGGGDATLAAKFILAEAGTRMRAKNAILLIACTVGSHASAPRNDQEQKHGGLAIVKTGVVPTTLTVNSIFINTSKQLGEFESGMLAAWLGAVPAAALGGIGTLLVVGLWMAWFPGLRRRQRLDKEATFN